MPIDLSTVLPILRELDGFTKHVVCVQTTPTLGYFLANVAPTPHGTVGIDYILHATLHEAGADVEDLLQEVCHAAFRNLSEGLKIGVSDDGDCKILEVTRTMAFGASALVIPGFLDDAAAWVETTELLLGFGDGDRLFGAPLGSGAADELEATIRACRPPAGTVNVYPRVLEYVDGVLTETFVGRELAR